MTDTSRPDCRTCQVRSADLREQRDPYTHEALYEDVAALLERADALLAVEVGA